MPKLVFVLDDGETYSTIASVILITDEAASKLDGEHPTDEYDNPSDFAAGDILLHQGITDALKNTIWDINHKSSPKTHEEVKALLLEWNEN